MAITEATCPNRDSLLAKARLGDRDAMSVLLRESQPLLQAKLAGRIPLDLQSVLSIEDVLQETFSEAFLDFKCFHGTDLVGFQSWLAKMADHNLLDAIDGLTAAKRGVRRADGRTLSLDDSQQQLLDSLVAGDTTPRSEVERRELRTRLDRAVQELPTAYREVVDRYDLNGQSAAEAAEALGLRLGAFWMRRNRALKLLRELLGTTSQFF